jgi:hypothetical protein
MELTTTGLSFNTPINYVVKGKDDERPMGTHGYCWTWKAEDVLTQVDIRRHKEYLRRGKRS